MQNFFRIILCIFFAFCIGAFFKDWSDPYKNPGFYSLMAMTNQYQTCLKGTQLKAEVVEQNLSTLPTLQSIANPNPEEDQPFPGTPTPEEDKTKTKDANKQETKQDALKAGQSSLVVSRMVSVVESIQNGNEYDRKITGSNLTVAPADIKVVSSDINEHEVWSAGKKVWNDLVLNKSTTGTVDPKDPFKDTGDLSIIRLLHYFGPYSPEDIIKFIVNKKYRVEQMDVDMNEKYLVIQLEPVNVWGRKIKLRIIKDPISGIVQIPEAEITVSSYTEWERFITYEKNKPVKIVMNSYHSDGAIWKITMLPDIRINASITEYNQVRGIVPVPGGLPK